jgi:hypothetical protein
LRGSPLAGCIACRAVAAAFGIRLAGKAAVIRIAPAVIQAVLERCGE